MNATDATLCSPSVIALLFNFSPQELQKRNHNSFVSRQKALQQNKNDGVRHSCNKNNFLFGRRLRFLPLTSSATNHYSSQILVHTIISPRLSLLSCVPVGGDLKSTTTAATPSCVVLQQKTATSTNRFK